MVAPLVAGAARVAATGAKAKKGAKTMRVGGKVVRRAAKTQPWRRDREENQQSYVYPQARMQRRFTHTQHRSEDFVDKTKAKINKAKAARKAWAVAYPLVWCYPAQALFALLFIIAVGWAESDSFWSFTYADAARDVVFVSWMILVAIGTMFMLYAAGALATLRVPVWDKSFAVFGFALCLALHFSPYLFLIPWVFLWLFIVVMTQK